MQNQKHIFNQETLLLVEECGKVMQVFINPKG